MSKNKIILFIGLVVAAMPFLGFPSTWKMLFYVLAGGGLILMSIIGHVKRRSVPVAFHPENSEVYVESHVYERNRSMSV